MSSAPSLVSEQTSPIKKSTLPGLGEIAKRLRNIAPILSFGLRFDEPLAQNEQSLVNTIDVLLTEAESLQKKVLEQSNRIAYLEELATTDELTGIFNRRGFEIELNQVLARAQRHDEEGVLVYVDLDGFKPVNDTSLAKTATRTDLPVPCGRLITPRTFWSAWRGSTPKFIATSTVSSNFAVHNSLTSLTASSIA